MEAVKKKPDAELGAWLSIGVYLLLSALKLAVGYFANSKALMADGLNNTTDIIASLAVLIGLRISKKPADADHRYGHSRAETVASMAASFIMFAVGIQVLMDAAGKLVQGDLQTPEMSAAIVAAVSSAVMFAVYRINLKLAARTGSHALKAAAADNKSDAFVSLGTVIGILASVWGLVWLDTFTAVIVALLICKTGWDIFREASHMLTDGFDVQELEKFKATVSKLSGVENVKDIKGRVYGKHIFLDLTIEVDQLMSVRESHAITEQIEDVLKKKYHIKHVLVHIEPH